MNGKIKQDFYAKFIRVPSPCTYDSDLFPTWITIQFK